MRQQSHGQGQAGDQIRRPDNEDGRLRHSPSALPFRQRLAMCDWKTSGNWLVSKKIQESSWRATQKQQLTSNSLRIASVASVRGAEKLPSFLSAAHFTVATPAAQLPPIRQPADPKQQSSSSLSNREESPVRAPCARNSPCAFPNHVL